MKYLHKFFFFFFFFLLLLFVIRLFFAVGHHSWIVQVETAIDTDVGAIYMGKVDRRNQEYARDRAHTELKRVHTQRRACVRWNVCTGKGPGYSIWIWRKKRKRGGEGCGSEGRRGETIKLSKATKKKGKEKKRYARGGEKKTSRRPVWSREGENELERDEYTGQPTTDRNIYIKRET